MPQKKMWLQIMFFLTDIFWPKYFCLFVDSLWPTAFTMQEEDTSAYMWWCGGSVKEEIATTGGGGGSESNWWEYNHHKYLQHILLQENMKMLI